MPKSTPEFVAAVDLGSNSFHMIVCSLKDGKLQTIDRLKEMVRLASGLDKKCHIDAPTQKRALECLERFGQRIRHFPPGSVRVVGTNTLRTAKNSAEFIAKAEIALNHPIHVIAGIEEARLIYIGVAHSLGSNANLRFVMDIGGGSTEYIIGQNETPRIKESLNMGCVSVSNLFFKEGKISKSAFTQAVLFARQKLEPFQKRFHRKNWDEAIGSSGTLRAIDKVLQVKNWSNNGITLEGLEQLVTHITQYSHIDQLNLPELDPERLPVFVGGVAIIYASFKSLGISQMTVSDGALREGVIQDLLGRLYNHDIRAATVQAVAKRYHTDKEHAARVKNTAQFMLEQVLAEQYLPEHENLRQFLNWAADLHEIGHEIAHSQYHKHGAYIIKNADLAGFSRQDQLILSTIIRYHRRRFSLEPFAELNAPWDKNGPYLTLLLRLAVLLHRNRDEKALPEFKITFNRNKIRLQFPTVWLNQAPLTQADLIKEACFLKAADYKLDFS